MSTKKRGRGRPSAGLTERLAVRLTPSEKRTIEEAARAADLSANDWLRRAAGYCAALKVPLVHVVTGPLPGAVE